MAHDGPARAGRAESRRLRALRLPALVAVAAVGVLAGCAAPTSEAEPVDLAGVESATVTIEASGAVLGSGFIVDPSGLVVTSNAVVGDDPVTVRVGGELYGGELVETAECLDLAVLDIEGEDHPFLALAEGPDAEDLEADPAAGPVADDQEVWAAGHGLDDAAFTLAEGTVERADAPAATAVAAATSTVEYTVDGEHTGSGGPLVDDLGRVVGVRWAPVDEAANPVALHVDELRRVLPDLSAGRDVGSLGISGRASSSSAEAPSGVAVLAVRPGSLAQTAGLQAGDLLTRLDGVRLGQDGTLADYCSLLQANRGSLETMSVQAHRASDGQVYVGTLAGNALARRSGPERSTSPATGDFVTVQDDTGFVSVEVPAGWQDQDGTTITDDSGNVVYDVTAAVRLDDFVDNWSSSGISVTASVEALDDQTPETLLDSSNAAAALDCTGSQGRQPYVDDLHEGLYQIRTGCGTEQATFVSIAAEAKDGSHLIWLELTLSPPDAAVLDRVVDTFGALIETDEPPVARPSPR